MAKFDVIIREVNYPNRGAFLYGSVEAESKQAAMSEIMELHKIAFNIWDEPLTASAKHSDRAVKHVQLPLGA